MFQATERIFTELSKDSNLKVFTEETDDSSRVWLQFGLESGGSYRIRFISKDNDNDVAVRVFGLTNVDDAQRAKVLPFLNEMNAQYRFIRFVLDKDNDVNIEYDYLVDCPDPAASARELIIRIVRIIDDVYPQLMRAIWA